MAKKTVNAASAKVIKAKPTKTKAGGSETASMRILQALVSQRAVGIVDADRGTIQGLAAMPNKKSFDTTLLNMKKKQGWVTYTTTTVTLTDAGIEEMGGAEAVAFPTNNTAMQDKLKENIKQKKSREIFDLLADGRAFTRTELADKMGMEDNKSFGTCISALSTVVEREGGKIRLKDIAFPCGRPCGDE